MSNKGKEAERIMKANKFFAALLVFVTLLTTAALAETSDYTATAQGFGGLVEVTLFMTDETITNAMIVADNETPAIGGAVHSAGADSGCQQR